MTRKTPTITAPDQKVGAGRYMPHEIVIDGAVVSAMVHPAKTNCCRAVFPVNKTTVLKVEAETASKWYRRQNYLECKAYEALKDHPTIGRFLAETWGYDSVEVTSTRGRKVRLSWCFQRRLTGDQVTIAHLSWWDDEKNAIRPKAVTVKGNVPDSEWQEFKDAVNDVFHKPGRFQDTAMPRQCRFATKRGKRWLCHDFAELGRWV